MNPDISRTIIGPRTREPLEDNLAALQITLSLEELQRIDQISPPRESVVPFYQAEFGPHLQRI